jgi:hypothetical protein
MAAATAITGGPVGGKLGRLSGKMTVAASPRETVRRRLHDALSLNKLIAAVNEPAAIQGDFTI